MPTERLQRHLAAVLVADVVGYSRLIGIDEVATIKRLQELRAEVIAPSLASYRGRLVKEMGDGVLVEFPSVVDAVECAVAIQRSMDERESGMPEDRRIRCRIGVNLGDVVSEGDDILGDGVNVAARLQALADPGGISISGPVYDQVRGKLDLAFDDDGEQRVKNIRDPVRIYRVRFRISAAVADLAQAERDYRQVVRARYAEDAAFYIPLSGSTAADDQPHRVRSPRSARRFGQRARIEYHEWIAVGEEIRHVRVEDLRDSVERYPCVILLGDPGCGKTTALEMLALAYAERPERIPLLLRLGELGNGASLDPFISEGWGGSPRAGHWGAPALAANVGKFLEEGRLLFLFDALNEMPQKGYRECCLALRTFIDAWAPRGNRFVVSCRSLDYGDELSGLQRIEVQPLTDGQVRQFLENELPAGWRALWQQLQAGAGQHRLLELARNPYLLTVMIDVFEEDEQLSRNRAELMRRFTEIMLGWAKAKCPAELWVDPALQIESLSVAAWEMQARSGFGTKVRTEQVKAVMPTRLQLDPRWPATDVSPEQMLDLAARAHIVEMPVDRTNVRFCHQLLQEYFAARRLVQQDPDELDRLWRVPWLEADMPPWSRPENNFEPLPPPPSTPWEETVLLAAGMIPAADRRLLHALLRNNPLLAGRCLLEPGSSSDPELRGEVVARLLPAIADAAVALRVRIAAGHVLGELGDPRIGEVASIPAGPFLMGSAREQHEVFLREFRIGRFPVTHAEYRRFVDAGGYRERRWWTEAGWADICAEQAAPRFWRDSRFNRPNQPMLGLSWYECVAYCRWLSHETGGLWRLPTEAEWEKAARGVEGREFPWGNEFDPERLNGRGPRDRQVCATTPIGAYPGGVSPFGLYDCVGNVWEWCATRWMKPYPYDSCEDEWRSDYLEGRNLRALRGGSWYHARETTRCAYRHRFEPSGWNDRGGFRLVSSA